MRAPVARSSSTNIHMLGVTTPAIGPTARRWWHGSSDTPVPGLEQRDGVLGVVDQPLERGAAHQRAAQRPGRAVPGDRRARRAGTGRARGRAPRTAGATSTRWAVTPSIAASARSLASRRSGSAATVARSASVPGIGGRQSTRVDRRRPGRRPRRRAGRRRRTRRGSGVLIGRSSRTLRRARARGGSARALDRWTSAPASTSAPHLAVAALRVGVGADDRDHHRLARPPAIAGASSGGRVRLGAVAEHDVEQHDPGAGVGRRPGRRCSRRSVGSIIGCARPAV